MATVQGLYLALFGRPADPLGLAYFNGITNNGTNLANISSLTGSAEYQTRFAGQSPAQIVNSIYQSLFNRPAEAAGLTFFVNELVSGRQNINTIAINILDGAQGADKTVLDNKLAAANLFTTRLDTGAEIVGYSGDAAAAAGRAFIQGVTTTVPTQAATDAAIVNATQSGGGGTGNTFTLTTGVDFADNAGSSRNGGTIPSTFKFTTSNDTVVASTATLAPVAGVFDTVSDASTTDEDVAQISVSANTQITNFTNIENLDITFSAASAITFVTTTGVKDIDLFGVGGTTLNGVAATGVSSIDGSALSGAGYTASMAGVTQGVAFVGSAFADVVTGGNGVDNFNTGSGIDTIVDGAGADIIRAGGGDDIINLANDSASDRIVFEATAAANGNDAISGFTGGSTNGDVLDVSAFLGKAASTQIVNGDTYVGGVAQDDGPLGSGGNVSANAGSNVIVIRFDTDVTPANILTTINGGAGNLTLAAESKYVIALDTATGAGGAHNLYYVQTGLNGSVLAENIQLVGTVTAAGDLTGANFA